MSEENIENVDIQVDEKNIPVFIETDGHVIQVGFASEVNESGGRSIEKFSAFKKVVLVNPIFGDGEGEIQIPIESHIDPEEEGLTGPGNETSVDGHPIDPAAPTAPAPVEAGTDQELNAEPVAADPDGSDLLENDAPAQDGHPFGSDDHDENVSSDLSADDEEAEFERQLAEEQAAQTRREVRENNDGA